MHQSSGNWKLGLALALTTALMWGLLPIAVKDLLVVLDPWTITFYRFAGAAVLMGYLLWRRHQLPRLNNRSWRFWALLGIAIVGLCANYILFLLGLERTTPATTQVLIQLAPMLLLLGGLWLFKERFSRIQWAGFLTFVVGLGLFFNQRLPEVLAMHSTYAWGSLLVVGAAITWAAYALAQKQLLVHLSSFGIMWLILCVGSAGFVWLADLGSVAKLDIVGWGMLVFSSLNTAIAYGAFAEALAHWEASRVSAVLSLTPVITVICLEILSWIFPARFTQEPLNFLTILGIFVVVAGSAMTALGKAKTVDATSDTTSPASMTAKSKA
ncbi:MAG: DMT family transporter [Gammaproteobacteria bacterium]|nr:MAG: DMT family transporter [Gammaproteobacteria bacterium]